MLAIDKAILSYAAVAAVAAVAIWMFPVAIAYGYQNPVTAPAVKVINSEAETWELLETVGSPTARHEATFVAFKNKIYLLGGRRINPVDVFDPQTSTWTAKSKSPIELHHFQAVVYDELIYLIGAMTGPYPNEKPVQRVVSYDPAEDKFEFSHPIPVDRRRGGAGACRRHNDDRAANAALPRRRAGAAAGARAPLPRRGRRRLRLPRRGGRAGGARRAAAGGSWAVVGPLCRPRLPHGGGGGA